MTSQQRAEAIAKGLVWLFALSLFVWLWVEGGSFLAALLMTFVSVMVLLLLLGPLLAVLALLLGWLADLIWPPRPRP
ncbi:MAG: hypothetical protein AB1735_02065 [Pseudomonadota bacterium]|jgi:hypothetical protein